MPSCDRDVRAREYCNTHYQRALRGADMDAAHRETPTYGPVCLADGCDRESGVRGFCGGHYARFREGRDLGSPLRVVDPHRGCLVSDCDRKHCARGYCDLHLARAHGRTNLPLDAPIRTSLFDPCNWAASHARCRALWGSASQYSCIDCGLQAKDWAYDGADPSERLGETDPANIGSSSLVRYSLYPEFYMPMCRKCHAIRDKGAAKAELREYRLWKHRTGLTLADITEQQLIESVA